MAYARTVSQRIDDLVALEKSGGEALVPAIVKALKDRSPSIRTNAVQMIGRRSILKLLPNLEACLTDHRWLVRTETAVALGDLLEDSGKAHSGLRKLLKDENYVVRIDAMEALVAIGDFAAERLIAPLLNHKNGIVRPYCARVMVDVGGKNCLSQLRKALWKDNDDRARVGLMSALFRLGEREHLPAMLHLLGSEDYRLRCAVINNLEDLQMNEGERSLVHKACNALSRHEPTRAVAASISRLLKLLRQQEREERKAHLRG